MGGGSEAPTPPTPEVPSSVAATQQAYNTGSGVTSQAGSMVNQKNPYANLDYTQSGVGPNGVPIYTANSSYSAPVQNLLNSLWGGAANQLGSSGYGTGNVAQTVGNMTSGTTKDLLDKEVSYLNPFFNQQNEQLDAQMRNQGLFPSPGGGGTSAYDTAMNNLRQGQNQTVTGFLAQAEPSAYQQSLQTFLTPLQMAQQMMGMANPSQLTGSFINPPGLNVQPANYQNADANYNAANMAKYQADLAQNTNYMSGLFGIGGSVLGGLARNPAVGAALLA